MDEEFQLNFFCYLSDKAVSALFTIYLISSHILCIHIKDQYDNHRVMKFCELFRSRPLDQLIMTIDGVITPQSNCYV